MSATKSVGHVEREIEDALAVLSRTPVEALPRGLEGLHRLISAAGLHPIVSLRYASDSRKIRIDADESYWDPKTGFVEIRFAPDAAAGAKPDGKQSNTNGPVGLDAFGNRASSQCAKLNAWMAQRTATGEPFTVLDVAAAMEVSPNTVWGHLNRLLHRNLAKKMDHGYLLMPPSTSVGTESTSDLGDAAQCTAIGTSLSQQSRDLLLALDSAEREPRFREFVGIKQFRDQYLPNLALAWATDPAERHKALVSAIDSGVILKGSVVNPHFPTFPTTTVRVNREHPAVQQFLQSQASERSTFHPISVGGEPLSQTVIAGRR